MADETDFLEQTQPLEIEDTHPDQTSREKIIGRLHVSEASHPGPSEFSLHEGVNIIGRHPDCDVCIKDKVLSKRHAAIEVTEGTFLLYDLGSTNRTKIDRLVLKPHVRYRLTNGDQLLFGNFKLDFVIEVLSKDADDSFDFYNMETQKYPSSPVEKEPQSSGSSTTDPINLGELPLESQPGPSGIHDASKQETDTCAAPTQLYQGKIPCSPSGDDTDDEIAVRTTRVHFKEAEDEDDDLDAATQLFTPNRTSNDTSACEENPKSPQQGFPAENPEGSPKNSDDEDDSLCAAPTQPYFAREKIISSDEDTGSEEGPKEPLLPKRESGSASDSKERDDEESLATQPYLAPDVAKLPEEDDDDGDATDPEDRVGDRPQSRDSPSECDETDLEDEVQVRAKAQTQGHSSTAVPEVPDLTPKSKHPPSPLPASEDEATDASDSILVPDSQMCQGAADAIGNQSYVAESFMEESNLEDAKTDGGLLLEDEEQRVEDGPETILQAETQPCELQSAPQDAPFVPDTLDVEMNPAEEKEKELTAVEKETSKKVTGKKGERKEEEAVPESPKNEELTALDNEYQKAEESKTKDQQLEEGIILQAETQPCELESAPQDVPFVPETLDMEMNPVQDQAGTSKNREAASDSQDDQQISKRPKRSRSKAYLESGPDTQKMDVPQDVEQTGSVSQASKASRKSSRLSNIKDSKKQCVIEDVSKDLEENDSVPQSSKTSKRSRSKSPFESAPDSKDSQTALNNFEDISRDVKQNDSVSQSSKVSRRSRRKLHLELEPDTKDKKEQNVLEEQIVNVSQTSKRSKTDVLPESGRDRNDNVEQNNFEDTPKNKEQMDSVPPSSIVSTRSRAKPHSDSGPDVMDTREQCDLEVVVKNVEQLGSTPESSKALGKSRSKSPLESGSNGKDSKEQNVIDDIRKDIEETDNVSQSSRTSKRTRSKAHPESVPELKDKKSNVSGDSPRDMEQVDKVSQSSKTSRRSRAKAHLESGPQEQIDFEVVPRVIIEQIDNVQLSYKSSRNKAHLEPGPNTEDENVSKDIEETENVPQSSKASRRTRSKAHSESEPVQKEIQNVEELEAPSCVGKTKQGEDAEAGNNSQDGHQRSHRLKRLKRSRNEACSESEQVTKNSKEQILFEDIPKDDVKQADSVLQGSKTTRKSRSEAHAEDGLRKEKILDESNVGDDGQQGSGNAETDNGIQNVEKPQENVAGSSSRKKKDAEEAGSNSQNRLRRSKGPRSPRSETNLELGLDLKEQNDLDSSRDIEQSEKSQGAKTPKRSRSEVRTNSSRKGKLQNKSNMGDEALPEDVEAAGDSEDVEKLRTELPSEVQPGNKKTQNASDTILGNKEDNGIRDLEGPKEEATRARASKRKKKTGAGDEEAGTNSQDGHQRSKGPKRSRSEAYSELGPDARDSKEQSGLEDVLRDEEQIGNFPQGSNATKRSRSEVHAKHSSRKGKTQNKVSVGDDALLGDAEAAGDSDKVAKKLRTHLEVELVSVEQKMHVDVSGNKDADKSIQDLEESNETGTQGRSKRKKIGAGDEEASSNSQQRSKGSKKPRSEPNLESGLDTRNDGEEADDTVAVDVREASDVPLEAGTSAQKSKKSKKETKATPRPAAEDQTPSSAESTPLKRREKGAKLEHIISSLTSGSRKRRNINQEGTPTSSSDSPASTCTELTEAGAKKPRRGKVALFSEDSSPKKVELGSVKVCFTGISSNDYKKVVSSLKGVIVDDISCCTHLITDKFRRTVKMLCCISKGIPVVSVQWLKASSKQGIFVDHEPHLVSDEGAEKQHGFKLANTLRQSRESPLLEGWSIHVTPRVSPPPDSMKEIICSAGGKYLPRKPTRYSDQMVVVSCTDDVGSLANVVKCGIPVVEAEFILTGILRHSIDLEAFRLNGTESQAASAGTTPTKGAKKKTSRR